MKRKIWILSLIILFCGNSHAQKYAEEFLIKQRSNDKRETVYLIPAHEIIRTDLSLLNEAEDSAVLQTFNNTITQQLIFYGFNVKQVNELPDSLPENECSLEISQLEAEEYSFYDSVVSEENNNLKFYKKLSGVKINVWLTFNALQKDEKIILYNEEQIQDFLSGFFEKEDNGNYYINYEIININPNDLYLITYNNAVNSAKYFFNFLINRYVFFKTEGNDGNFYGISDNRTVIKRKYPFDTFETVNDL